MATTLGLDIGTTSIGWCLLDDNNRIVRSGVRIFPVGVQEDKYAKNTVEISRNAARRSARGIRRGYDRYKLRRKQLRRILLEIGMLPERLEIPSARYLYGLRTKALDEQLSLQELGRVILHLNQRRGFKSNRKADVAEEKERSEIKLAMQQLQHRVKDEGFRTLGEFFHNLYLRNGERPDWHNPDEPVERIRKRFVPRSLYVAEFEAIWRKQQEFYPELLTEERRRQIMDRCIYYQRPLKSQKGRVAFCRFEPKKRVAPRSSLGFQEFRIWETLARIAVTDATRQLQPLTLDEKKKLAAILNVSKEISQSKIKSTLKLSKAAYFNELPDKIKGNTTAAAMIAALGAEKWDSMSAEEREHAWHVLYFATEDEWLFRWAKRNLGVDDEAAAAFASISLEPDYSRISVKALRKLLPFLQEGQVYSKAAELAGYHHSYDASAQGKDRVLEARIVRDAKNDPLKNILNPLVKRAVSETVTLVNAIIQEQGRPDRIRIEFARSLQMPKDAREKILNRNRDKERRREEYREFLQRKFPQWKSISNSQILKFELWLEMEYSESDLRRLRSDIDFGAFRKFAGTVKPTDRHKYELWLECGRISPYTGNTIPLSRLFSSDIEIEHIVPYSRSMDNSFRNKTLSEREFNMLKGNKTPYEYFRDKPEELRAFKERVKGLPYPKQKLLLGEEIEQDFRPGMIESTAMIAKETRDILRRVCLDVRVTGGQATSVLRRFWGLNTILNPDGTNEKSRYDHRHHAVDAFVIACTTDWWINLLSQASSFDASGRQKLDEIWHTPQGRELLQAAGGGLSETDPLGLTTDYNPATGEVYAGGVPGPYQGYRQELEDHLTRMFVSYRKDKRLLSSRTNPYRYSVSAKGKPKQQSRTIRGPLHAESVFGRIHNSHTGKEEYVIRKPLAALDKLKQVERIVDPAIRSIVRDRIMEAGGESAMKEILQKDIFILSRDGSKKIPIRTVRLTEPAKQLIQLRPKENPKLFVDSGSNYCMAVYGDEAKKDYETITFYTAVQRELKGLTIVPPEKNGLPLLCTLQQRDLVVVYETSPDEIDWENHQDLFTRLYKVRSLAVALDLMLDRHNRSSIEKSEHENYIRVRSTQDLRFVKVRVTPTGMLRRADD